MWSRSNTESPSGRAGPGWGQAQTPHDPDGPATGCHPHRHASHLLVPAGPPWARIRFPWLDRTPPAGTSSHARHATSQLRAAPGGPALASHRLHAVGVPHFHQTTMNLPREGLGGGAASEHGRRGTLARFDFTLAATWAILLAACAAFWFVVARLLGVA